MKLKTFFTVLFCNVALGICIEPSTTKVRMSTTKNVIHEGSTNGSTAILVDKKFLFVAEDENNVIRLFSRQKSGPAYTSVDVGPWLGLSGKEVDIEGSCRSPSMPARVYWIGSLSNNKNGKIRPDRDRLFATDVVGQNARATLQFAGYVADLRPHLAAWGDAHGYGFSACMAKGVEPKRVDGFNVEGLETSPDGKTLYIALRAPLVGKQRDLALIVPLLDFENWFANGHPRTPPVFGAPVELALGKRGIRSLGKNARGEYLIVAGSVDGSENFALFQWDGQPKSAPRLRDADLRGLAPEGIVEVPEDLSGAITVQLLSDQGSERETQSSWVEVR
jgi:hypothetical protein